MILYQTTIACQSRSKTFILDLFPLTYAFCAAQAEASKVLELCAREATMIFGGNALMIGGVGDKIECAVAQVKGSVYKLCHKVLL